MKTIFLIFIGLISFSILKSQSNINFISEDITFEIKEDTFFINGNYFFQNKKDTCTSNIILYPFPVVDYMGEAYDFEIFAHNKTKYSVINTDKRRALFKAEHCGNDLYYINMKYKQEILNDSAKYILTTTKNWKQALQSVNYKLITPSNIKVVNFSYKPDSKLKLKNTTVYFWYKTNFYPDKDFIITIEK